MAKYQKTPPPPTKEIEIPLFLAPLMQAFRVDSEKEAKALLEEAAYAIYGRKDEPEGDFDFCNRKHVISENELERILFLMKGISPKDTLETLYAAQIVVSYMLGMRKLSQSYQGDQKLGLKLFRFSCEAMQQLQRQRSRGTQHITVNYNYNDQRSTPTQIVTPSIARTLQQTTPKAEDCTCPSEE